jgi:nucleoside 2-deoxyribosyltransferase
MLEYIYIVHISECVNRQQSIYKLGKTKQSPKKRFDSYPKGSIVVLLVQVDNCDKAEIELKKQFNENFRRADEHGIEYFEGSISKMIELVVNYQYNPSIFDKCQECNISIMCNSSYFQFCCKNYHKHCLDKIVAKNGLVCLVCKQEFGMEKVYYAGKIVKGVDGNSNHGGYPRLWTRRPCREGSSDDDEPGINVTNEKLKAFISPAYIKQTKKVKTPAYTSYVELIGPKVSYCPRKDCLNCNAPHGAMEDRGYVVEDCTQRIANADVVVGLINKERDCYGTIFELGMAMMMGKPTYIIFENDDRDYNDLWFIAKKTLMSLNNGDQKYRTIRSYTIFNSLPTNVVTNERGLWTDWTSTIFHNEDEYIDKVMLSTGIDS